MGLKTKCQNCRGGQGCVVWGAQSRGDACGHWLHPPSILPPLPPSIHPSLRPSIPPPTHPSLPPSLNLYILPSLHPSLPLPLHCPSFCSAASGASQEPEQCPGKSPSSEKSSPFFLNLQRKVRCWEESNVLQSCAGQRAQPEATGQVPALRAVEVWGSGARTLAAELFQSPL